MTQIARKASLFWGILGTGWIAGVFAAGLARSKTGKAFAVASRNAAKARESSVRHSIVQCYGSYEELLQDKEVDAIYIATPHAEQAEWTVKACEAGKDVLCEKPWAINHGQAMAMVEAARREGVLLLEGYSRCHPQMEKLVELLHKREVGDVRVIEARFSFCVERNDSESRWYNKGLGGGGILDIGGYPVSIARLIAGLAEGEDFANPLEIKGVAQFGETGTDAYSSATILFFGGIVAEVACGVTIHLENTVKIIGSNGTVTILVPWVLDSENGSNPEIVIRRKASDSVERLFSPTLLSSFSLEADAFAEGVLTGNAPYPAASIEDSLGNMETLDRWRPSVGLQYEQDLNSQTVKGTPLCRLSSAPMRYGTIPGITKRVSRLVMGVDNQKLLSDAAALFDVFFEEGGNAFDTAWTYLNGECERFLGKWIALRGIRGDVVILEKCAHPPFCNPSSVTRQIEESLDRLQTSYIDICMLHRDNPAVSVGEFVDLQ